MSKLNLCLQKVRFSSHTETWWPICILRFKFVINNKYYDIVYDYEAAMTANGIYQYNKKLVIDDPIFSSMRVG